MEAPPLLPAFGVSANKFRWPWMLSSSVRGQCVTVSCPASDWFVESCPWWLDAQREGNQLLLTPKNCGFHTGKVRLQHGHESVSIRASAWIIPSFTRAVLGIGAASATGLLPLLFAALIFIVSLVFLIFIPYYGVGVAVPLAVGTALVLGPIPLVMGCLWGALLRSWKAWFHSLNGTVLGAVLALVMFFAYGGPKIMHAQTNGTAAPASVLFAVVFVLALSWVGAVAMCTAGTRMILPTIPVVLAATALIVFGMDDFWRESLSGTERMGAETKAWSAVPQNKESPGEIFRLFAWIPDLFRFTRLTMSVGMCVQLVFAASLPLLMMFVVPIPKPAPPRQRVSRTARMEWRNDPRVVPSAWRRLRL